MSGIGMQPAAKSPGAWGNIFSLKPVAWVKLMKPRNHPLTEEALPRLDHRATQHEHGSRGFKSGGSKWFQSLATESMTTD